MPNVDWIQKEPESRAMSSHTFRYVITPNPTYDSREATIIFKEKKMPVYTSQKYMEREFNNFITLFL